MYNFKFFQKFVVQNNYHMFYHFNTKIKNFKKNDYFIFRHKILHFQTFSTIFYCTKQLLHFLIISKMLLCSPIYSLNFFLYSSLILTSLNSTFIIMFSRYYSWLFFHYPVVPFFVKMAFFVR